MESTLRFSPLGDCALSVIGGDEISPAINKKLRQLAEKIREKQIKGILELAPTYTAIIIYYDPLIFTYDELCQLLLDLEKNGTTEESGGLVRIIELPTVYGGEYGEDLPFVAQHTGFTEEEVIKNHTSRDYLVYMLGFLPGFAYLGGMDPALETPRLKTPRERIIKGSVGIAGKQTGTYPSDSPGGWQIIGRTPVPLYDLASENGALLRAGDYVRYVPIDEKTFKDLEAQGENIQVRIHHCKEEEVRL